MHHDIGYAIIIMIMIMIIISLPWIPGLNKDPTLLRAGRAPRCVSMLQHRDHHHHPPPPFLAVCSVLSESRHEEW